MKEILIILFIILSVNFSGCANKKYHKVQIPPKLLPDSRKIEASTPKFVIYETEPIPLPGNQIPRYTDNARSAGLEGRVIVRAEVFEDGTVGAVEVVKSLQSGEGGLDEQALKAVRTWKFVPAKNKEKPVKVWITFPLRFEL